MQLVVWGQCGNLLTVYRQVGYFHCAANCVINSLSTESIDRSPGVSVCFLFSSFASLVSITASLTVQGQWMIVPLVFLLSPYLRLHRVQSCKEALWITVPLSLTCFLSCPRIPHLISHIHTPARSPMWILHPLVLSEPQWQKHSVLFVSYCTHWSRGIYRHRLTNRGRVQHEI